MTDYFWLYHVPVTFTLPKGKISPTLAEQLQAVDMGETGWSLDADIAMPCATDIMEPSVSSVRMHVKRAYPNAKSIQVWTGHAHWQRCGGRQ